MKVDPTLLQSMRAHRARQSGLANLYPYAMGRIDVILSDPIMSARKKVAGCLEIIAALDIVEGEPKATADMDAVLKVI